MDRREFIKNTIVVGCSALGYGSLTKYSSSPLDQEHRLIRPPGALPEHEFLSRCIQCLRCADTCPNQAIITFASAFDKLLQDTPVIKPRRQACMLCNSIEGKYLKCTEVCPSGALQLICKTPETIQQKVAMGTAEIDSALCYSHNNWICGTCYRACPFPGKAMTLGLWEKPEVHAEACVGCGACERACIRYPQAIRVMKRV